MWFKAVFVPLLAIFGLWTGVRVVNLGAQEPKKIEPFLSPASPPFEKWVAGSGVIEPIKEPVLVASPYNELVSEVAVAEGDRVTVGQLLFRLDSRELEAQRAVNLAAVKVSEQEYQNAQEALNFFRSIKARRALSEDSRREREYAVRIAKAKLNQAKKVYAQTEARLERFEVRSPIAGDILRVNVKVGELAQPAVGESIEETPVIVGNLAQLQVRVDIDEYDAWRYRPGARGKLYLRGNPVFNRELKFLRVEPLVVPKSSLSGDSKERVDTRVLQIIYSLEPNDFPVYPGQLVDVYLESL